MIIKYKNIRFIKNSLIPIFTFYYVFNYIILII